MRALVSLFGVLMVIALMIKLIWWILGAVVLYVLFRIVRWQLRLDRARREGIYGQYPVSDLFGERRGSLSS
jgi:hypothetical protein